MSERFVSGVSAKIALYKYSSFPFLSFYQLLFNPDMIRGSACWKQLAIVIKLHCEQILPVAAQQQHTRAASITAVLPHQLAIEWRLQCTPSHSR